MMRSRNEHSRDDLFACSPDAPDHWASPASEPDALLDRIDSTLALLADATAAALDVHPPRHYDVTVIVPVYNERATLLCVLDRIAEVMPPATEMIVVDDASDDGTGDLLAEIATRPRCRVLRRRRNHGKGSAVRQAIRHSRGRVVVIQDADLEYDPANLLAVIWPILENRADVVYGSRYLVAGNDDSRWHRFGNWALTWMSNRLTGLALTDMETCHKGFRGDLLRSIPLRECRFGFEPEITAKVAARKARVIEVPTRYNGRGYREGKKIGWRDAVAAIHCLWRYRRGEAGGDVARGTAATRPQPGSWRR